MIREYLTTIIIPLKGDPPLTSAFSPFFHLLHLLPSAFNLLPFVFNLLSFVFNLLLLLSTFYLLPSTFYLLPSTDKSDFLLVRQKTCPLPSKSPSTHPVHRTRSHIHLHSSLPHPPTFTYIHTHIYTMAASPDRSHVGLSHFSRGMSFSFFQRYPIPSP